MIASIDTTTIYPNIEADSSFQLDTSGNTNAQYEITQPLTPGQEPTKSKYELNKKTLKRLRGFVYEFSGSDVIVVFIENGNEYKYTMPKNLLKKNGITELNQPFEMNELEIEDKDGLYLKTTFKPIAASNISTIVSFELSEEEKEMRKRVLTHNYAEV